VRFGSALPAARAWSAASASAHSACSRVCSSSVRLRFDAFSVSVAASQDAAAPLITGWSISV
jgi:hypothetical protein